MSAAAHLATGEAGSEGGLGGGPVQLSCESVLRFCNKPVSVDSALAGVARSRARGGALVNAVRRRALRSAAPSRTWRASWGPHGSR
jgi:hypothetical protein